MPTILQIKDQIKAGTSVVTIVEEALKKAEAAKEFNALISLTKDRALSRATEIDKKMQAGQSVGRLAGVPFIAKDNFLAFGAPTTAASNILKIFEAPYQATAIEKLEQQGAILIGKANLDAFAHGSSTENSDFGVVKNPHDKTRVAGGSSGGSAASVALDIVPFALGTDTGGSIRLPASFCGVVGLKPTYGLVSRYGVVAMASSTDVIGPITNTVDDAALVLDIMAGRDDRDGTLLPRQDSYLPSSVKNLKIGLVKEYMDDSLTPDVRLAVEKTVDKLKSLGHQVSEVSLPSLPLALAIYYVVVPAEVSSNLARYDGIKFGLSAHDAKDLNEVYGLSRDQGFNAENKRRILIGTYVLSSGYYDAYYLKAQTVRTKMINEFKTAFSDFDILLGPTAPDVAFKIGAKAADPLKMYLNDIMTVAANLTGVPAISLPVGKSDDLPVGVQLMADFQAEPLMFGLAKQIMEPVNG